MSSAELQGVRFGFGKTLVFDGLTFATTPGLTAILGPNGAGKSSLLAILASLRRPTSGRVVWFGDPRARLGDVRERIGFLPQSFSLVRSMKVQETVAYSAWAHGVPAAECDQAAHEALNLVEMDAHAARKCGRLSGGQRQRVGLACALVHRPELLLLDEPTAGLDPMVRLGLRASLERLAEGATVVLSTHLTDDVEYLADRVVVLDNGVVLLDGTPTRLATLGQDSVQGASGSLLERGYERLLSDARS